MNLNLYKIPNVSTTFFAVRRIYEAFLEERKPFLARAATLVLRGVFYNGYGGIGQRESKTGHATRSVDRRVTTSFIV